MKALSLRQPYAELLISGKKTIELRKWNTKFRGKFLVHASRTPDYETMKKLGFNELPLGFIVGMAELVGVKVYKNKQEFDKDRDKHLADSSFWSFGFILKNAERINPIPAKRKLNFWEFKNEI